ncbi:MAG: regulatory protein RecX [Oscillospiraceae bacterium]|nr:regulatory protein RecX [Oscillospiraceae bacterium]
MEISVTTAKSGRINIHADGEYYFTVPALIWYASPISSKKEADEEELFALKALGEEHDAYEKALRLLSNRAHGEKELKMKLRQKYSDEAADSAILKLTENGLIDDEKFARDLAEELSRRKSYSAERIKNELISRGIDRETAKNAANSLDIDKKAGIINIISKIHLPESPTKKDVDRLLRRLLTAGYSMSEIREVISFSEEDY